MKNLIKISILSAGFFFSMSSVVMAQQRMGDQNRASQQTQSANNNGFKGGQPSVQTQPTKQVGNVNRNNVDFRKEKTKVIAVNKRPNNAQPITYNNKNYQYKEGKYYLETGGRYVNVNPTRGMRVQNIPSSYQKISFGNLMYYFLDGIFYNHNNGYYEVVDPQVGTVVSALPAGYEKVNYNGSMYYEFNGVLFSKVSRGYQVVGYLD